MKKNVISAIAIGAIVIAISLYLTPGALSKDTGDAVVLSVHNTLNLSDEVNGETVGDVIKQAKKLKPASSLVRNADKERIYLFLNTPGGSIQSGLELIEALKGLDRPVDTITMFAASMGFQIAQNMNERLIVKNGTLMSHRARGQMGGEFGGQNPSQLQNRMKFWSTKIDEMDDVTVAKTNGKQTLASYQAQYANELWMTGAQAVERGYADRIVTVKCDKTLDGVTEHTVSFLGMQVQFDLDNCPLNTAPSNVRMKIETTRGVMDYVEFIEKGGKFGAACLGLNDLNKVCAIDTTLNPIKIDQIKHDFTTKFNENRQKVVYMSVE